MLMICVFCSYNNYKLQATTESASVAYASACVASENRKITIMINSKKWEKSLRSGESTRLWLMWPGFYSGTVIRGLSV